MKLKSIFPASVMFILLFASCSKDDTGGGSGTTTITEKSMTNVSYGTDPLQKMDIFLPANRTVATTKVMILIHGGGWTSGDKADFALQMDTLKKRIPDYAIFNINYRLAAFPSTNAFPTQELDVRSAVDFIYGNRGSYLVSDKFVLMGASAGGHLSLLHAYKYHSPANIKAVVDFFGPTDMSVMYTDYASNPPAQLSIVALMSGTPASNPTLYAQSSPMTFANAQAPPTIILQGATDPLVNATTQSFALKTKLTAMGVVNEYVLYPGGHGDWDVATYTDAYNKIQAFLTANVH
ncbi:MAG: alpha/beta hydrolase [Ferruginibacter sp.]